MQTSMKWLRLVLGLLCLSLTVGVGSVYARETVAILDFVTLDQFGNHIDPVSLGQPDLINLGRLLPQGMVSRLVQHGEYTVYDAVAMRDQFLTPSFSPQISPLEQARRILTEVEIDQVITGTITMLQSVVAVTVQRFQLVEGEPRLVGAAMEHAPRLTDAPGLVDALIASIFPASVQVIERPIDQIFLVPGQLRLNLGSSHQLTVYALDNLGRPVANPSFLFFSSDESKVSVDENGVVTALQPGTATITVRGISRTARSGAPATMSVTVVPPALGVRIGTMVTSREGISGRPIRLGLRLTPSFDQRNTAQKPGATPTPTVNDMSNPLVFISSFFSSLLTNGLMTIDLDFDPTKELLFAVNGVQRSSSGYIGTGVGYVTPLDGTEEHRGFNFRFTMGTQVRSGPRISIPMEVVADMIFPSTNALKPSLRVGLNIGLDLFP